MKTKLLHSSCKIGGKIIILEIIEIPKTLNPNNDHINYETYQKIRMLYQKLDTPRNKKVVKP